MQFPISRKNTHAERYPSLPVQITAIVHLLTAFPDTPKITSYQNFGVTLERPTASIQTPMRTFTILLTTYLQSLSNGMLSMDTPTPLQETTKKLIAATHLF